MSRFDNSERIGLRDKETDRLVAVYPHNIHGTDDEVKDKVFFWYYQQGCSAENELPNFYVDSLNENELKTLENEKKHNE